MVQYPAFPPTVLLSSVFADGSTWDCRSVSWSLAFLQKVSLNGVTACLDEIHTTMCDWKYHCKSYNNEKIAILVSNVLLDGWGGGRKCCCLSFASSRCVSMFTRQVYAAQTQYQKLKNVYCRAVWPDGWTALFFVLIANFTKSVSTLKSCKK